MTSQHKEILISVTSALIAYAVANVAEFSLIGALHPSETELTWISDAILSVSLGVVTYLWLHLKATRTSLTHLERAQVAMETELSLAAEIQRNLLPGPPAPMAGLHWAARLKQAGKIGGDFYDFIQPDSGPLLVLLGDISGKGIPAALLLSSVRTLFRILAREIHQPSELVERLSRAIYEDNAGSLFMTCLLCLFDLKQRTITFTNAGHPPGLIVSPKGQCLLETGGPPAGMFPSSFYQSKTISLEPDSIGIFFTDGISEAVERDETPATVILGAAISKIPRPIHPDLICDTLMQIAQNGGGPFGDGEWKDDQTILAFVVDC